MPFTTSSVAATTAEKSTLEALTPKFVAASTREAIQQQAGEISQHEQDVCAEKPMAQEVSDQKPELLFAEWKLGQEQCNQNDGTPQLEQVQSAGAADPLNGQVMSQEQSQQGVPEEEHAEAEQSKPRRRMSLRARVLAELGSGDALEAIARVSRELPEHDNLIALAQKVEAEKQEAVEAAEREVSEISKAVKDAANLELEALECVKAVKKRQRECAKRSVQGQKELQDQQDILLLLEMEATRRRQMTESAASMESEQDAKRQKIDELQRVVDEAKKAQDEMRQREREAREAMRNLVKEQKQLSRLGPFGRRQRAASKAKAGATGSGGPAGAVAVDGAPIVNLLPVKREVTQAFGAPRAPVTEVISIEDSQ